MPDLVGTINEVLAKLTAAGIHATADQRDLDPPGVYVTAPDLEYDKLDGQAHKEHLELVVVAPATGRLESYAILGPLLDQVRSAWPYKRGYRYDLQPLEGTDLLPAYRIPLSLDVKPGD